MRSRTKVLIAVVPLSIALATWVVPRLVIVANWPSVDYGQIECDDQPREFIYDLGAFRVALNKPAELDPAEKHPTLRQGKARIIHFNTVESPEGLGFDDHVRLFEEPRPRLGALLLEGWGEVSRLRTISKIRAMPLFQCPARADKAKRMIAFEALDGANGEIYVWVNNGSVVHYVIVTPREAPFGLERLSEVVCGLSLRDTQ